MVEPERQTAMLRGCDATHRASNSDTHLTHGCIQLFRQFSRLRQGCAGKVGFGSAANATFSKGAPRTLAETER
jgi:hypothetical protein